MRTPHPAPAEVPAETFSAGDALLRRAAAAPAQTCHVFLGDGEAVTARYSFGELAARATDIACWLHDSRLASAPVVLALRSGLDYVAAFWGCLLAGAPAVPAHPSDERTQAAERLWGIVADCRPGVVFGDAAEDRGLAGVLHPEARRVCMEAIPAGFAAGRTLPPLSPEALAYLQYSSGSTRAPRGARIRHGNLQATVHQVVTGPIPGAWAAGCHWLPLFHDMGLTAVVLCPILVGRPVTFMPPDRFLRRPMRWLRAIAASGATFAAAPDFAYRLCVERSRPEERLELDLRGWKVALCGAEPVRATTLRAFGEAFAPCGFDPGAFVPSYGMAEATAIVSGGGVTGGPTFRRLSRAALEEGRVVAAPAGAGEDAVEVVGCGVPVAETAVLVVDPETHRSVAEGAVGELWVGGPQVADGYDRPGPEDAARFEARLEAGEGPYLRTGDLGFLADGEVFVLGRRDDVLVVRGRNLHPADLERVVEAEAPWVLPGAAVVMAAPGIAAEGIVVAVAARPEVSEPAALLADLRRAFTRRLEVAPRQVLLLRRGDIPRTTSGKLQRQELRRRLGSGELQVLAREGGEEATGVDAAELPGAGAPAGEDAIASRLAQLWAEVLEVPAVPPGSDFFHLGGDSLRAATLETMVEETFRVAIPLRTLFERAELEQMAETIRAHQAGGGGNLTPASSWEDIPTLPVRSLLGHLPEFGRDPTGLLTQAQDQLGDLFRLELGKDLAVVACHPDDARDILQRDADAYDMRVEAATRAMVPILGDSILTSDGERWREQRTRLARALSPARLAWLSSVTRRETLAMLERWRARSRDGGTLKLWEELGRLTLSISQDHLLGLGGLEDQIEAQALVAELLRIIRRRQSRSWSLPDWLPTRENRSWSAALQALEQVLERLTARTAAGAPEGTVVGDLLARPAPGPGDQSPEKVMRDEIANVLLTTTMTTSTALVWSFFYLAGHPEERAALESELASSDPVEAGTTVVGLRSRRATRVFMEALRLRPPVWNMARRVRDEVEVRGHRLPVGANVFCPPVLIHRHPDFWEDPAAFDSDRFLPERMSRMAPGAYVPFGLGQRRCLGETFSSLEATLVIEELVRTVRVIPLNADEVVCEASIVLLPDPDLEVRLEWRP